MTLDTRDYLTIIGDKEVALALLRGELAGRDQQIAELHKAKTELETALAVATQGSTPKLPEDMRGLDR